MVMYRIAGIIMLGVSLLSAPSVVAQTKVAAAAKPKKIFMPQAYLGNSDYKGGIIPKELLGNLLKQGLTSRDSLGNKYKVVGFEFVYAERMLYEDSVGNLMVNVDYLSEYCTGDTLSAGITNNIYERMKSGDSAFFNKIEVLKTKPGEAGGTVIMGKGMKFAITK
jgi:hypothetical protein